MTSANPFRYVRLCAWCGPMFLVATILFWGVLGHNIPPYSAGLDAPTFAARFRADATSIRIGMVGMLVFTVLYLVWGVGISKVMEQVERDNNVLSTLQIWGAGFTAVIFALASTTWLAGTFRAETLSPELSQFVYDLGWIQFDMAYTLTTLQLVALGVCLLGDRRPQPLLPPWICWYSIWVGLMFFLLAVMPVFRSGPFSRSGVLNYWVEFPAFFLFMAATSGYLIRAVGRLERQHVAAAERDDVPARPGATHVGS
jgi:hypothetical protein